jgi:hypothetical protein
MRFGSSVLTDSPTAVIYLNGIKYRVTISDIEFEDISVMPIKAAVQIAKTDEDLTQSNRDWNSYYKFGGFPVFLQNSVEPCCSCSRKPYTYICTLQTDWGDMGNANIFALISDSGDEVEDVFVEASCS